jgi:cell division protein FtsZ
VLSGGATAPSPHAVPRSAARNGDFNPAGHGGSGLFGDPTRADAPAAAPRKSLFGIVTGAIRGSLPSSGAAEPGQANPGPASGRMEPSLREQPREPLRAAVRQAAGEEMAIDIPAFLRRQSS